MRGERTGAVGFETEMLARGPRRRQRAANSEIFLGCCAARGRATDWIPVPCTRSVGLWWCRRVNAATVRVSFLPSHSVQPC